MHPELITLPGGFSIKMYGFFLMVGFLSAVWLGMRRATRVHVDPDRVLDISFVALIAGVGGARLFYVIHYWQTQFADQPNKLLAIVDIRQGGLEFLGGFLGAIGAAAIYILLKKQSIRLYFDVLAPSVMWGVAFGRLGCFFNGCCFGGICAVPETGAPQYAWAVQFPFGSSAQIRQWEDRQTTIPAELMTTGPDVLLPWPVSATLLQTPPDKRDRPLREFEELARRYRQARENVPDAEQTERLKAEVEAARNRLVAAQQELATVRFAQQYPSRFTPKRRTLLSELSDLAREHESKPVHPVQLYASFNAFLLSALLSMVFYRRKRHGVVIGLLWVFYPIARFFEESLRVDNPHEVLGLTVSQAISVAMFALGVISLIVLYAWLPQRSPLADAAAPPPVEEVSA